MRFQVKERFTMPQVTENELLDALEFAYSQDVMPRQPNEFTQGDYFQLVTTKGETITRWQVRNRLDNMIQKGILVKRLGPLRTNLYRKA
jgi:hypothetical protein